MRRAWRWPLRVVGAALAGGLATLAGCLAYPWDSIRIEPGIEPELRRLEDALRQSVAQGSLEDDRLLFARALSIALRRSLEPATAQQLTSAAIAGLARPVRPDPDPTGPARAGRPVDAAIVAMLESLDPRSAYFFVPPPRDATASLGVELALLDDGAAGLAIVEVSPESPAERAGIQPFDRLIAVDGVPVDGLAPEQLLALLEGPAGSTTTIAVRPQSGTDVRLYHLERARVRTRSVRAERLPGEVGYFRVRTFLDTTPWDLQTEIHRLDRDAPLRGLLLDLRFNSGGTLDSSVRVAELFLSTGTILRVRSRSAGEPREIKAETARTLPELPMTVLVNETTEGGAEIVAAALIDNRRAASVGTKTPGYPWITSLYFLAPDRAMRLTTASADAPRGASIREGVTPAVVVAEADEELRVTAAADPVVRRALESLPLAGGSPSAAPPSLASP